MPAESTWDREVDVLVFGSGAAGMACALVAAQEGLQVLLCEKSSLIGGTTAISGGEMWIPGSHHSRAQGIVDGAGEAARYWEAEVGEATASAHRSAFLRHAPEAIEYLERHTELRFRAVAPHPDYHQDLPGASAGGRPLATLPFDGRRLGADFARLRPPRTDFMVFGGMMVTRDDIVALLKPLASWKSFAASASLVGRFLRDRLRHPRGTRLVLGNALVARMLYSLRAKGVEIAVDTPLQSLVHEGDAVTGAVVRAQGRVQHIRARRGVVLATGGFAADPALRARYMKALPIEHALCFSGDTGDALTAALAIGAAVDDTPKTPAYWMPASVLVASDGTRSVFPHIRDRARPGLIIVNAEGRRFVNESASYHDVSLAMFEQAAQGIALPAWLVCDRQFIRQHGLGMIKPIWQRLAPYLKAGYLIEGRTVADLARRIGVDAPTLEATVARHNESARAGVDPDFGKGRTVYNRHYGDPSHGPNPCLAPIEHGPFYAVAVAPAPIGTTVGLKIDVHANVLDGTGMPIRGLYACGNDMASITRGAYPGPGSTLGPAVVFAYLAMKHLASQQGSP
jgi:3-oxosteroid 1-dehydrogenase